MLQKFIQKVRKTKSSISVDQDKNKSPVIIINTTQDKGVFLFLHILNEISWYIEILETILKLEIIDYIFKKIITLKEVNILESPNEYYQKQV